MKQERIRNGRCNRVARLEKPDGLSEARDFSHEFFTCRKKQEKESAEKIEEAKKHNIFFDRQKEWQLYCEYFKKTYGKMLEKEGEEFWKKYFEWCEITDEEREKVDELRKELGV